jgi:tartrate-resistant acid phosphatase type 5
MKKSPPSPKHCIAVALAVALAVISTSSFSIGQTSVRFAVIGDYGANNSSEQSVANLVKSWTPDFIVTTGDNSYGSTSIDINIGKYYHEFIGNYTGSQGAGSPTNRFFPSIGNHDYTDGGRINAYLNYFTLPGAGIQTTNTSGNERYYDFIQGPIHFFVINSNSQEPDGITSSSTQALWLQTQLAASTSPWKIVVDHHPPYSSGTTHGSTPSLQWPFQDWGATAVLSGHEHNYERIIRSGFPYFVNGSGGNTLYNDFGTPVTGSVVRYSSDWGAMLIDANSDCITFKFYSITSGSTLIDTYTINALQAYVKVMLEGPFSGSTMSTALRTAGYIPTSQPYNSAPWNYIGLENVTSIPANVVDWVLVELRTGTAASTKVATRAAFVKSDGSVVDLNGTSTVGFGSRAAGSYYIVIRHRNHLAVMSTGVVSLSSSSTLYDFTTGSGQYYGGVNAAKDLGSGVWGMIAGDVDVNGGIGASDLVSVLAAVGSLAYDINDVDMNGGVGASDLILCLSNVGQISQVP